MTNHLTEQELHNLAMNIVGKDLESQGFEFLGVNSKLKKDPQFVALKNKDLHFVIVRAVSHPNDANTMREQRITLLEEFDGAEAIEIEIDETVTPGGCIVESELMQVDARLETLLADQDIAHLVLAHGYLADIYGHQAFLDADDRRPRQR